MTIEPAPAIGGAAAAARPQLRLLGAVQLQVGSQQILRFPARAVVLLLARLALAPDRAHAREELVELLWPGVGLAVGRNRLRQVLSTLKALVEPTGSAPVLLADRMSLRVAADAIDCDALRFEQAVRAGRQQEAAALWRGELMPGYYDDWVAHERQRLSALRDRLPDGMERRPAAPADRAPATPIQPATPLPHYLTRLFGAELPLARVHALVRSQRLVTLTGPGGSGKTRLAVEVAHAFAEPREWAAPTAEPGPAFERLAFVPLVTCNDAAQMLAALAQALQLPLNDADPARAVAALTEALTGRTTLLVLDNFEQLVGVEGGAPARAVAALLAALPRLHVLVSSRRALALDGECCIEAEPLAPATDAVALFADRARAARADFQMGSQDLAAVASLVRRLGGLPLAIELAASRVRSFTPADMLRLLDVPDASGAHRTLLARSGPRAGHDPRHASMAEVMAWSWRLLDEGERRVLSASCLFAGDATAGALAQVLGEPLLSVAARLDSLVAHSLVRAAGEDAGAARETRFGLMEPVREFALDQLAPGRGVALRSGIRRWLLRWAQGLGAAPAPADVAPELRSLHAVLAAAPEAPRETLEIALALRGYWDSDGLPGALQASLEQALALLPGAADLALRSELHEMLAYLRFEAGYAAEALAHADAALALADASEAAEPGDRAGLSRRARALVRRAWVELAAGRTEDEDSPAHERLQRWLDKALALARSDADRDAEARALHQMAVIESHVRRDWRRAESLLAQAQALWESLGDRRKAHARLRNRAQCWQHLGRADDALVSLAFCERAARDDGDWVGQIDSLISMTALLASRRRWAEALAANRRCVALCWQRWHRHGLAYALWNPPRILARLGQPEAAMRMMAFAAQFWVRGFGPLASADRRYVRRVRGLVEAQIGAACAQAAWLEGEAMDIAQAVALAMDDPTAGPRSAGARPDGSGLEYLRP